MGDQVKFNVVNALKDPDDFKSCQMNADIKEKTRPTNAVLKDQILKDGEDGEEDEIKLLSNCVIEPIRLVQQIHDKDRAVIKRAFNA